MKLLLLPLAAALLRGRGAESGERALDELELGELADWRDAELDLHLEEVDRANATAGVHRCGCVTPVDEQRRDLKRLRWLHFPKTGTSFWSTVFSYACRKKGPVDMDVSPFWKKPGCGACYDFAIKERYPPQEFCAPDAFEPAQFGHQPLETQHQPLGTSVPEETVAFFRHPKERLLSSAINNHMSGFSPPRYQAALQQCYKPRVDANCFANFPGIKGCQARMLTGGFCADDGAAVGQPFPVDVQQAIALVRRLGFVGLTEDWNDSVCLFHKMFGGKVTQAEFKNFHPSHGPKPNVDVVDELDGPVYAAAKQRFTQLLKQHGAQKCYSFSPAPKCVPRTCEAAGAECGAIDNGCGGQLQCGLCPQFRAGPATCGTAAFNAENTCLTPATPHAAGTFAVSSYRR